jgi:hypothetical protein
MNDKQKNTAAIGGARTRGCRIKPEMRKGQVKKLSGNDARSQTKFVLHLFHVAA